MQITHALTCFNITKWISAATNEQRKPLVSESKCCNQKRRYYSITTTGIAISLDILRLSLDVEPLPDKGFRPGELHNAKRNRNKSIRMRNAEKLTERKKQHQQIGLKNAHTLLLLLLSSLIVS
jgi:hypothetical protein